jgi:hypothetical protein
MHTLSLQNAPSVVGPGLANACALPKPMAPSTPAANSVFRTVDDVSMVDPPEVATDGAGTRAGHASRRKSLATPPA